MFKCCNQVTKKQKENENGTEIVFYFLKIEEYIFVK